MKYFPISWIIMINGLLSTDRNVLPHEAETAGAIMAFFLSLGLALGASLSFVFRALV